MKTLIEKKTRTLAALGLALAFSAWAIGACGSSDNTAPADSGENGAEQEAVYPMFIDGNANQVNDYFEAGTHDPGSSARASGPAASGHMFTDSGGDGICDYAQNGSNTWHGPGFEDENANGICDYWEEGTGHYNQGGGMMFRDQNRNMVNDYFEAQWHSATGHGFIDNDGDGICDRAQNGTAGIWHGPGFVDDDGDGVCDLWQEGGRGHGGSHGGHGGMM
ncbi:MAG: hypothetical protein ACNS63_02900 [Candidatus Nitrospinota bacterium M3_3B_026]